MNYNYSGYDPFIYRKKKNENRKRRAKNNK